MPEVTPAVAVLGTQGAPRGVVLLLHGGKADSFERAETRHLSAVRLTPFARLLHEGGHAAGVAVWRLRYRFRGWNGSAMSPVSDVQWALREVRSRHGQIPVVLLGHSMGGRAAVHVLGDPSVHRAVLLAPWLYPDSPVSGARDRDVLVLHGTRDRWTSPSHAADWVDRAAVVARQAAYLSMHGDGHFMLRRPRLWTEIAAGYALAGLGLHPSAGPAAAKVLSEAAQGTAWLHV